MKRISLLVCFLLSLQSLSAQFTHTVSGIVKDTTGQAMIGANVWLKIGRDSLHAATNESGHFSISNVAVTSFSLRISLLGYEPYLRSFSFENAGERIELPALTLVSKTSDLREVIVKGQAPPVIIKEDTLEYRAGDYRMKENSVVEDLLKRLPGVEVDKDGNILMMGKKVNKLRINGKDYLVDDIKTLTRILPVNMIDKVQLLEDYGDMARMTGRKSGDPLQVLNIQTKAELNKGIQTQVLAGYGDDGRYNGGFLANYFNGPHQLSVSGNTNNTTAVSGTGTNTTGAVNYRDQPGKDLSLNMSAMAGTIKSDVQSVSNVTTVTNEGTLYIANKSSNVSSAKNGSFFGGLEYKPANGDLFNVNVNMGWNKTITQSVVSSLQTGYQRKDQFTDNTVDNYIPILGMGVFGSHRFKKKGRVFSLSAYFSRNGNNNDQDGLNDLLYYDDGEVVKDSLLHQVLKKRNVDYISAAQTSWIEPIDSSSSIEFRYFLTYTNSQNKITTDWLFPDGKSERIESLSNDYNVHIAQHQLELNYRKDYGKLDYTIGARLMPSVMSGDGIRSLSSSPLAPVLRVQYKLPRSRFISLFYNGVITFPTFQQLLPTPDLTNAQFPIIGNPDLKPSFVHSVYINYRAMNTAKNSTLFMHVSGNYTLDKVVTNTVTVQDSFNTVKQETRYLNTNGDYNYRFVYGWSRRYVDGKFVIYLDGSAAYNNNILYLQDIKNTSKNTVISQSVRDGIILDWLELITSASYTYNRNVYLPGADNTTNLTTIGLALNTKVFFLKTWMIGLDANKQYNNGYSGSLGSNPLIANATLEKTLFKKRLTCRAQVFNLLNENARLSQTISGNTVTESRDNLMRRYFMFTLQLDLKKFAGVK
jgi:hypothetical protein